MDQNHEKWFMFAKGASPTILFLLMSSVLKSGFIVFFGSIVYLVVGLIIYGYLRSKNHDNKSLARAFAAGAISGAMATFFLSVKLCSSGIF